MRFKSCINFLLTVAQSEVFLTLSNRLASYDITPGQYGILDCLWENTQASPKELAQELYLENSTISGMLDRMQKKGLIDRQLDPNDRRSIQVVLTPEGAALEKDILKIVDEVNQQVLGKFDEHTKQTLLSCLKQIGEVE